MIGVIEHGLGLSPADIATALKQDARSTLASFRDKLRALSREWSSLWITDPTETEYPDVASPTPWANTLLWPHDEYVKVRSAWNTLAVNRTGRDRIFISKDQETPPIVAQRIDDLLKETEPKVEKKFNYLYLVGGLALLGGIAWIATRNRHDS